MTKTEFYKLWLERGKPRQTFEMYGRIYLYPEPEWRPSETPIRDYSDPIHRVRQKRNEDWMQYLFRKAATVTRYERWIYGFFDMEKQA